MKAKFVNEAIKHLKPRSEEEIITNLKKMSDEEIFQIWLHALNISEEKDMYDELKYRNAELYTNKIKRLVTQLIVPRPYVNESIKHLKPRSKEEINTLAQFINNIKPENDDKYCEDFTFHQNTVNIIACIKKHIRGISDNEIERFMAFTFSDIINEIPTYYFQENNLEKINQFIENKISSYSNSWMSMHSDNAMKQMMRNSGMR